MKLATEAIEKNIPLEKKCLSEKNFLTNYDSDGEPYIYDYIASVKNLTSTEKRRLHGLLAIIAILRLPVEEVQNDE